MIGLRVGVFTRRRATATEPPLPCTRTRHRQRSIPRHHFSRPGQYRGLRFRRSVRVVTPARGTTGGLDCARVSPTDGDGNGLRQELDLGPIRHSDRNCAGLGGAVAELCGRSRRPGQRPSLWPPSMGAGPRRLERPSTADAVNEALRSCGLGGTRLARLRGESTAKSTEANAK